MALFDAIHSVDRPSLAEALAKEIARQGRQPTLFVEVNTGAEAQKAGVLPEETDAFLKACRETHGLTIAGLMCIPRSMKPPAPHFALTAKIARRNGLRLLSMGMSADFALAIAFGATHVRVGTAIFGARTRSAARRSSSATIIGYRMMIRARPAWAMSRRSVPAAMRHAPGGRRPGRAGHMHKDRAAAPARADGRCGRSR